MERPTVGRVIDAETWAPRGTERMPAASVGQFELAALLDELAYPLAAAVVRKGYRDLGEAIGAELRVIACPDTDPLDDHLLAAVDLWRLGHDPAAHVEAALSLHARRVTEETAR